MDGTYAIYFKEVFAMRIKTHRNLTLFAWAIMVSASASAMDASDIPGSLVNARQAYMEGDPNRALQELKTTFERHRQDESVTENSLGLLKQILREHSSLNPAETKLPPELSKLKIALRRQLKNDNIQFSLSIKASQRTAAKVKDVKMAYFNGEALLDSQAGLGKVTLENEDRPTYKIARYDLSSPPPEGPIEIFMTFDNGHVWHGWAPLVDLVATTSPTILSPNHNETIRTGTPTFRWRDYISPEYQPATEKRAYWAAIYDDTTRPWTDLVTKDSWDSDGLPLMAVPAEKELPDGTYGFTVHYSEIKLFGEIKLDRQSASYRTFQVKKQAPKESRQ